TMDKWTEVVTHPLGLAGFVLFLLFSLVAHWRRDSQWAMPVFSSAGDRGSHRRPRVGVRRPIRIVGGEPLSHSVTILFLCDSTCETRKFVNSCDQRFKRACSRADSMTNDNVRCEYIMQWKEQVNRFENALSHAENLLPDHMRNGFRLIVTPSSSIPNPPTAWSLSNSFTLCIP